MVSNGKVFNFKLSAILGLALGILFSFSSTAQLAIPDVEQDQLLYRINAGGPLQEYASQNTVFEEDTLYEGGRTVQYVGRSISGTVYDAVYASERFSSDHLGSFDYALPIAAKGDYLVILHFAEIYHNAPAKRIMNVTAEDRQVITALDIFDQVGANKAYQRQFVVNVIDDDLNLIFTASVDRPKVSAIEVYSLKCATSCENKSRFYADRDGDGYGDRADSVFACCAPSGFVSNNDDNCPEDPGKIDPGFCGCNSSDPVDEILKYAINSGGGPLSLTGMNFESDQFFTSGHATSKSLMDIKNTDYDHLYSSERYSYYDQGDFSYDIPLAPGFYKIVIHLAEIYFNESGKRLMSVQAENTSLLFDYDIFEEVGGNTAVAKSYVLQVADGELNLKFSARKDRPKVSGLEIYQLVQTGDCDEGCEKRVWYADQDGDGFGDVSDAIISCDPPVGYVRSTPDFCPYDSQKTSPGWCGCGTPEDSCGKELAEECFDNSFDPGYTGGYKAGATLYYRGFAYKALKDVNFFNSSSSDWELIAICLARNAVDCSSYDLWDSNAYYPVVNTSVIYEGEIFKNKTPAGPADIPGSSLAWRLAGACIYNTIPRFSGNREKLTVTTTQLADFAEVFPTLIEDRINISTIKTCKYAIYDLSGKTIVSEQNLNAGTSSLDFADKPSGVYILKIYDDQNSSIKKIVKK